MKDCILDNSSIKKLKSCLKSKNLILKKQLDSLNNLINEAYVQEYIKTGPNHHQIKDTAVNVGATPPDLISALVTALTDGAIKIWTQISTVKKQQKDAYLSQISNKDYDLSPYEDLINLSHKSK
jgi:hypothetical protein